MHPQPVSPRSPAWTAQGPTSIALGGQVDPQSFDPLVPLLERTTFGFTQGNLAEARSRGFHGWLDWQLAPELIDDSALDQRLAVYPTLTMSAREIYLAHSIAQGNQDVPKTELRSARLLRAVFSKRQLYERMVEFWTDHFNVKLLLRDNYLKHIDDREVIREHALGNFGDLLSASARSGAMLIYLDNALNKSGAPNENYAREVMELHTLGATGPYDEDDVRELARCFTGWRFHPSSQNNFGAFYFDAAEHDTGPKSLLGLTIPAGGGVGDAQTVLDHLAGSPSTARYVTRKLARFILGYEPPIEAVNQAVAAFLSSNGHIPSVLRALLTSHYLESSGAYKRRKRKRPLHLLASLLRAVDAPLPTPEAGLELLESLGHLPYEWPAPNGYPDSLDAWGSTLLPRWSSLHDILMGQAPWTGVTPQALTLLLHTVPVSGWARAVSERLCGGQFQTTEIARVQSFIDSQAAVLPLSTLAAEAFGLAALSQNYQRY